MQKNLIFGKKNLRTLIIGIIAASMAIILLLALTTEISQAQTETPLSDSAIELEAQPAFEGNFKYGEWLPIFVELTNQGEDNQVEVRVPVQNSGGTIVYTLPVELAAGARKRVILYVLPNNFSRAVTVQIYSGDQLINAQKVNIQPNPNINFLIGIVARQRGAISLVNTANLPGMQRNKILIDIGLSQIPDRYEGLRSFDLLIFNDVDVTRLSPKQISALEMWVRQGGRLVIGGGTGAPLTISAFEDSFLPAQIISTQSLDQLPGLVSFVGEKHPIRIPGPFIVAQIDPRAGKIISEQDNVPLIIEFPLEKGFVNFIALDLAISPFDAWNGTTAFWERLISTGSAYPDYLPTDISPRQQLASNMPYALSNLPILDLPSAKGLALMLAIYILMVGPVNYFVLQKYKKLHLAWITIPSLTIIFSAASFGMGYLLHGTDIFINKISLIQVSEDGRAHVDSFVGIFSPAQTTYEVEVSGGGMVSPLTPYYDPWNSSPSTEGFGGGRTVSLSQGEPALIKGFSVDQWSMQSFMSEGSSENIGTIESDLYLEDDAISGSIRNDTHYSFQDVYIILGNKFAPIGELNPGQKAQVNLNLLDIGSPNFGGSLSYAMFEQQLNSTSSTLDRRKAESRRAILENLVERTPSYLSSKMPGGSNLISKKDPYFIGWIEQSPIEVRIIGVEPAEQSASVVIYPLRYEFPDSIKLSIPVGLIPGHLIEVPRDGGICGIPGDTAVYISRGEAIFEFNLPADFLQNKKFDLKLGLWNDIQTLGSINVEFYNWKSQEWVQFSNFQSGINRIHEPSDFIRSDGVTQIKLSTPSNQSCIYVALGLETSQP